MATRTYKELRTEIAKLEQQAEEARKREVSEVVGKIKDLMHEFGLSISDLGYKQPKGSSVRTSRPPKYRDPDTGATWTGIGKPPKWMAEATKSGNTDRFLIRE